MTELRKNEFTSLLEMNELLFWEYPTFIKADIPQIGEITYYPKANRMQVNKGNKWIDDGFNFTKIHLSKIKDKLFTEKQVLQYVSFLASKNKSANELSITQYFNNQ